MTQDYFSSTSTDFKSNFEISNILLFEFLACRGFFKLKEFKTLPIGFSTNIGLTGFSFKHMKTKKNLTISISFQVVKEYNG